MTAPMSSPLERLGRLSLRRWLAMSALVWVVLVALLGWHAQATGRAARSELAGLDATNVGALDLTETNDRISRARRNLEQSTWALDSPVLLPLRVVPVVGRQFDSARSMATTSLEVVRAVEPIVAEAEAARTEAGSIDRVAFLRTFADHFAHLEAVLAAPDLGPSVGLVSPLADAREELGRQIAELADSAETGRIASTGLSSFLSDGDYLLLGANNAEMRVASGMHLSIGVMTIADGAITMPGLQPAEDLVPVPVTTIVDGDVADRWGFISPSSDFRALAHSARFDAFVGPQSIAMWEAKTGQEVDGAVQLDPFVLQALIEVLGPVEVQGFTLDATNTAQFLLVDQYEAFETEEQKDERRGIMSEAASVLAGRLATGEWDPLRLMQAMAPMVEGRHLMAYSTDPEVQSVWEELGMAGTLDGPETTMYVLNHGASKLDPFLDLAGRIDVEERDGSRRVTMTLEVTSRASDEINDYALGPWSGFALTEPGVYLGRIGAYVPGYATNLEWTSGEALQVVGPDGPVWQVATELVELAPGSTRTFSIAYDLPLDASRIETLPTTRLPAIQWTIGDTTVDDSVPRVLDLATLSVVSED